MTDKIIEIFLRYPNHYAKKEFLKLKSSIEIAMHGSNNISMEYELYEFQCMIDDMLESHPAVYTCRQFQREEQQAGDLLSGEHTQGAIKPREASEKKFKYPELDMACGASFKPLDTVEGGQQLEMQSEDRFMVDPSDMSASMSSSKWRRVISYLKKTFTKTGSQGSHLQQHSKDPAEALYLETDSLESKQKFEEHQTGHKLKEVWEIFKQKMKFEVLETHEDPEAYRHRGFHYTGKKDVMLWEQYGIRMHFPDHTTEASPTHSSRTSIHGTVSLLSVDHDDYIFPEGIELVSAVYNISAEQPFPEPVTVEIQHCVPLYWDDNASQLEMSFIIADTQHGPPYIFQELPGGEFKSGSSYGKIQCSHFSDIAIKIKWKFGYSIRLFAATYYPEKNRARFAVTKHLSAYINVSFNYHCNNLARVTIFRFNFCRMLEKSSEIL